MIVGSRFDSVLEWIDAQGRLQFLANPVSLADKTAGGRFSWDVGANEVLPGFEIGKLVGRRNGRAGIALPFALNNLSKGLVGHAALGVIASEGLAGHIASVEHEAVAGISVVRDGDYVEALFPLGFQVTPQGFGIERIECREGDFRPLVRENHAAVEVLKLRR